MDIWERWWAAGTKSHVAFVVHTSKQSPEDQEKMEGFLHRMGASAMQVPSRQTDWGSLNIVEAEMDMFGAAVDHYPSATHTVLVSEKTAPMISSKRFVETTLAGGLLYEKSAWKDFMESDGVDDEWYKKDFPDHQWVTEDFVKMFGCHDPSLVPSYSQQFIIVNRRHFQAIRARARVLIHKCRGGLEGMAPMVHGAPDEILLQSVIKSEFRDEIVDLVVGYYGAVSRGRAVVLDDAWVARNVSEICADNEEKLKIFGVRKFDPPSPLLVGLLESLGIIDKQ
ncbi:hypothetical protein DAPPUDRAFT_345356 [Daphnia pulex]|uniref:Uncharacterized protein n=1 Tax=Daphnia pulex TaxID=6669 RepID=E9I7C5_DAPPU|nr:hypothetical protein DAPPUDRAFT_345356 [Daphnia pulex]|eukprot:EFX60105.1 hypothetical protein DAPPUDRAFT_345356 [Daphnia pulex]